MVKKTKRMQAIHQVIDIDKVYTLSQAIDALKVSSKVKFDETVELAVVLGVNPQHSDQIVRSVVSLPHGLGKTIKVAVFAKGDKAQEARDAGADIVGDDDLCDKIKSGTIDFHKCIATPDMMPVVSKVAKILGPRGLMPNVKLGSVTANVAAAITSAKAGEVEFRAEKAGIVHAAVGKLSFDKTALLENVHAFVAAVSSAKPAGAKGQYFLSAYLSSTMGVGLKLDMQDIV